MQVQGTCSCYRQRRLPCHALEALSSRHHSHHLQARQHRPVRTHVSAEAVAGTGACWNATDTRHSSFPVRLRLSLSLCSRVTAAMQARAPAGVVGLPSLLTCHMYSKYAKCDASRMRAHRRSHHHRSRRHLANTQQQDPDSGGASGTTCTGAR